MNVDQERRNRASVEAADLVAADYILACEAYARAQRQLLLSPDDYRAKLFESASWYRRRDLIIAFQATLLRLRSDGLDDFARTLEDGSRRCVQLAEELANVIIHQHEAAAIAA